LFANGEIQTPPYSVRKERLKKLKVVWLIEVSQYDEQRIMAWRCGGILCSVCPQLKPNKKQKVQVTFYGSIVFPSSWD
jgi:hypothetical protein